MYERTPLRTVAADVLNNRSRTADKGGPPLWVLGEVLIIPKLKSYYVAHYSKTPRNYHLLRDGFLSVSSCHHTSISTSDTFFHLSLYSLIYHRHYTNLVTGNVVKQHKNICCPYVSQPQCQSVCGAGAWRLPEPQSSHFLLCRSTLHLYKILFCLHFQRGGKFQYTHVLERSCGVVRRIRSTIFHTNSGLPLKNKTLI